MYPSFQYRSFASASRQSGRYKFEQVASDSTESRRDDEDEDEDEEDDEDSDDLDDLDNWDDDVCATLPRTPYLALTWVGIFCEGGAGAELPSCLEKAGAPFACFFLLLIAT